MLNLLTIFIKSLKKMVQVQNNNRRRFSTLKWTSRRGMHKSDGDDSGEVRACAFIGLVFVLHCLCFIRNDMRTGRPFRHP